MRISKRCEGAATRQPSATVSTVALIAPSTACTSSSGTEAPSRRASRSRRSRTKGAARVPQNSSTCMGPALPPPHSRISAVARSSAATGKPGSTPRSKRCAASVNNPKRRDPAAMICGCQCAASSSTSVVASLIAVLRPPIIPASPRAPLPSATTRNLASSVYSLSSSSVTRSPSRAQRTCRSGDNLARSNACRGCPSSDIT